MVIIYPFEKMKFVSIFFMYLFLPLNPMIAIEYSDHMAIDTLVKSCFKNTISCEEVLYKINNYQRNAVINEKFSCQTRMLGLEANLIMAMNFDLKRKEIKRVIDAIKKYC